MRHAWVVICLVILHPTAFTQDKPAKGTLKFPLAKASFPKGVLRLGFGLQGQAPEAGWRTTIGKDTLLFFDLDGNGLLEAEKDGLALNPHVFVVPIPGDLLLKSGQFTVTFDGIKTVLLTPQDLRLAPKLIEEAALLTELRVKAGVRPAALDAEACAACDKHCDYLKANGLAGGGGGMAAHDEQSGKPGYTAEGAVAGKQSCMEFGGSSLQGALERWYTTTWHGIPLVDPKLTRFGGTFRNGVGMIYFHKRDGKQEQNFVHPPDGAVGVPRAYASELPNPVPGTQNGAGCGFPVLIRLVPPFKELASAQVTDATGRPVVGTFSSPAKPANPEWPTNSACAVFIPSKPLAANTLYRVQFKLAEAKDPVSWSFTTGR